MLFDVIANGQKPTEYGQEQYCQTGAKDRFEAEDMVARNRRCEITADQKRGTGQKGGKHKSPCGMEATFAVGKHVH